MLKKLLAAKECCIQAHPWKDERQQQWGRKRRTSSRDNRSLVNQDCSSSHFNINHVKMDPGHGRNCLRQRQRQRCLHQGWRQKKNQGSGGSVEDSQNPSCWSSSLMVLGGTLSVESGQRSAGCLPGVVSVRLPTLPWNYVQFILSLSFKFACSSINVVAIKAWNETNIEYCIGQISILECPSNPTQFLL